jgi:hypothetical protein
MIKSSMQSKMASDSGSSNGGNQSDTSALVGFGFDFDSGEGNSANSEQNETSSDSDGGAPGSKKDKAKTTASSASSLMSVGHSNVSSQGGKNLNSMEEHHAAAAHASDNLKSIAAACAAKHKSGGRDTSCRKRKASDANDDNDGPKEVNEGPSYDSDNSSQISSKNPSNVLSGDGSKSMYAPPKKREERNAREKERSFRISKQIDELRDLLSAGGVIVAKGTKNSVLTEAANYIRMLQQHQYRAEM